MKILVVDDEEEVRNLVAVQLRGEGFTVVTARDPTDAREKAGDDTFDLLITDVDMGGKPSGILLAQELLAHRPALDVIMMSGADHADEIPAGIPLLVKPFSRRALLEVVDRFCRDVPAVLLAR